MSSSRRRRRPTRAAPTGSGSCAATVAKSTPVSMIISSPTSAATTKIVAVERNIEFSAVMSKLPPLCDYPELCFKHQLPGEDLDALISVTNDEDLEHMMAEYDRLHRTASKPARLRLSVFPLTPQSSSSFGNGHTKSVGQRQQRFVDASNSVQVQSPEGTSPQADTASPPLENPNFPSGLDMGLPSLQTAPTIPEVGT